MKQKEQYKMAVILPVYNEGEKICDVLKDVSDYAINHRDYYFLFVDDGSTDNTFEIIKSKINGHNNIGVVHYSNNKGKGNAVKFGFESVKAHNYCFTDSDLAYPLELIEIMEKELEQYDVVIGSRKLLDRKRRPNLVRHILGEGYNVILRLILRLPFKDTQAGLKGFRQDVVKKVFPKMTILGFGFDPEILFICRKHRFSIKEIPVVETEKHSYKTCKIKLTKDSLNMLKDLIKVCKNSLLRQYE